MDRVTVSGTVDASSILAESTMNIKTEFSAGCVVYKRSKINDLRSKIFFLLGKHSGYHKWVLPKGLIEKGEKSAQTAVRETEEELGIKVKLIGKTPISKENYSYYANLKTNQHPKNGCSKKPFRRVAQYQESFDSAQDKSNKTKIFKTVSFYLAEYISGDPKNHGWEMEDTGWFALAEALKLMSFKKEKEALIKASNYLANS